MDRQQFLEVIKKYGDNYIDIDYALYKHNFTFEEIRDVKMAIVDETYCIKPELLEKLKRGGCNYEK